VGDVLYGQNKLDEALLAYGEVLELCQKLAAQEPSNAERHHDLAVGYDRVGEMLRAHGKLDEALPVCRHALELREKLATQNLTNAGWQRELSASYITVGEVLRCQDKLAEALKAFQQALDITQKLVQQDPTNGHWQRDLGVVWERLGYVRQDQNDLTGAAEAYEYEMMIFGKLSWLKSEDTGLAADYAESKLNVAGVYRQIDRRHSALQLLEQARDILIDLKNRNPLSHSQEQVLDRIEKELSTFKETKNLL
jgi:tetratricopeptide (TPR) repeat protein